MLVGEVVQPAICVAARKKLHAFQLRLARRAVTCAGPSAGSSWPTDAEMLNQKDRNGSTSDSDSCPPIGLCEAVVKERERDIERLRPSDWSVDVTQDLRRVIDEWRQRERDGVKIDSVSRH